MANKTKQTETMNWRVDSPALLKELSGAGLPRSAGVLKIPLNIFQSLLAEVAKRAIELNDKQLNKLMIRLNFYELSIEEAQEYLES